MSIGNVELLHKCFLKHLRMRTGRMKDKETEEVDKMRRVNMERRIAGTKKISPDSLRVARAGPGHVAKCDWGARCQMYLAVRTKGS